ncbi:MAG: NADH-quinone oxidoreductase subunit C [Nitrososphaeria archaeon]
MNLKEELSRISQAVEIDEKRSHYKVSIDDPSKLIKAAEDLKSLGFDHVVSVTGVDYPDKIEVIWHVSSYSVEELKSINLALSVSVKKPEPRKEYDPNKHALVLKRPPVRVPSLVSVWPSGAFNEREAFEMFGIIFEGHPDLRYLMLPEDFHEAWPLRKDFQHEKTKVFLE